MEKYYYLLVLLFSAAYPLAQSFEKRLQYYKKWPAVLAGVLVMMAIFTPWDIAFASNGIWWFNERYILGLRIFHLPIEEWLFFLIIPMCCVFILEVFRHFFPSNRVFAQISKPLILLFSLAFIGFGSFYYFKLYSSIVGIGTGVMGLLFVKFGSRQITGEFLRYYLVSLVPFLLVNGVLTGSFTPEPIVGYNPTHITNIRIFSVPVEDAVYCFMMLLIVYLIYIRKYPMNKPQAAS